VEDNTELVVEIYEDGETTEISQSRNQRLYLSLSYFGMSEEARSALSQDMSLLINVPHSFSFAFFLLLAFPFFST
jgi:hypothetical protein